MQDTATKTKFQPKRKSLVNREPAYELKNFAPLPIRLIQDSKVSSDAFRLYSIMVSFSWELTGCFPGQKTLARMMGFGENDKKIRTLLKELKKLGLISWKQEGLTKTNTYFLEKVPAKWTGPGLNGRTPEKASRSGTDDLQSKPSDKLEEEPVDEGSTNGGFSPSPTGQSQTPPLYEQPTEISSLVANQSFPQSGSSSLTTSLRSANSGATANRLAKEVSDDAIEKFKKWHPEYTDAQLSDGLVALIRLGQDYESDDAILKHLENIIPKQLEASSRAMQKLETQHPDEAQIIRHFFKTFELQTGHAHPSVHPGAMLDAAREMSEKECEISWVERYFETIDEEYWNLMHFASPGILENLEYSMR